MNQLSWLCIRLSYPFPSWVVLNLFWVMDPIFCMLEGVLMGVLTPIQGLPSLAEERCSEGGAAGAVPGFWTTAGSWASRSPAAGELGLVLALGWTLPLMSGWRETSRVVVAAPGSDHDGQRLPVGLGVWRAPARREAAQSHCCNTVVTVTLGCPSSRCGEM